MSERKGANLETVPGMPPPGDAVPSEVATGGLDLVPPPPARLDPSVRLRKRGRPLRASGADVLGFWSWAFSDLRPDHHRVVA